MPDRWTNKQTQLIWEWVQKHPELKKLLRDAIDRDLLRDGSHDGDHDELRENVMAYLFPIDPLRDTLDKLVQVALEGADWDQLKAVILPTDGDHP